MRPGHFEEAVEALRKVCATQVRVPFDHPDLELLTVAEIRRAAYWLQATEPEPALLIREDHLFVIRRPKRILMAWDGANGLQRVSPAAEQEGAAR